MQIQDIGGARRESGPAAKGRAPDDAAAPRFDVDFSLAMYNRTGKYFIGRDLIDCTADLIGKVRYAGLARPRSPSGLPARIASKLQRWQVRLNARRDPHRRLLVRRGARPVLHLEPYTALTAQLRRDDAVLCHDVGPITHPGLFEPALHRPYQAIFAEIARIGPHLIFASRTSRREFERLFPEASPASAAVIYPAIRTDVAAPEPSPVAGLDGPFLLTVGSIGDRKNQHRCIRAFARSGLATRGVRYVLCGGREPGFEAVAELAARTRGVVLMPYVADAELAWLYGEARGFVLASLLEGFGIPLSEAISHGVVPLVSVDSVLHEVAGDGALLVDPESEEEIAAAMIRLAELDDAERARRLVLLRAAIERFTIETFRVEWRAALARMLAQNAAERC